MLLALALAAAATAAPWVAGGVKRARRPRGQRVYFRERAAGVDVRLQRFLDWWEVHGPFPIAVLPDGGVRTDAAKQLEYFNRGTSKARTLAETAHGRAGGLDVAPYDVAGRTPLWEGPGVLAQFEVIGAVAKVLLHLEWGGDWASFPDPGHLQVRDWRSLPYPPRR